MVLEQKILKETQNGYSILHSQVTVARSGWWLVGGVAGARCPLVLRMLCRHLHRLQHTIPGITTPGHTLPAAPAARTTDTTPTQAAGPRPGCSRGLSTTGAGDLSCREPGLQSVVELDTGVHEVFTITENGECPLELRIFVSASNC